MDDQVYPTEEIRAAKDALCRVAAQGFGVEDVKVVLAHLQEMESALNWQTSCVACARVLGSSVRETERAEKAESRAAGLQEEVEYLSRRISQLTSSLNRLNEKLRLTHRRAIEAENLPRKERRTPRVTDHTFEPGPEFPGLCHTAMFGQVCAVEAEFHELVEDEDKPVRTPLAEWEDHVIAHGSPPEEHWYLSTACHHLLHDKCRLTCKFCPEPCSSCVCACHQSPETD